MLPAKRALGSLTLFSCVNGEFLGCSNDIGVLEAIIQTGKEKEKRQEDNADVLVILLLLVGLKFFVIPGDTQEVQKEKFCGWSQWLSGVCTFLYLLNFEPCKCIIYSKNK